MHEVKPLDIDETGSVEGASNDSFPFAARYSGFGWLTQPESQLSGIW